MKCDELKPIFIPTRGITGDTSLGVGYYPSNAVDEALAELKTKLAEEREFGLNRAKSADHEIGKLCAELCELKAENRKHQRALWLARAERAQEMAWNFHEKNLVEKCAKWDNVHLMCRAKAEEYK